MSTVRAYFYRFKCNKMEGTGMCQRTVYDRFYHGVFTSDSEDDADPWQYVSDMAKEKHPDADNIDITALNLL